VQTYVIFLDLTQSLNAAQQTSVDRTIEQLCQGMPGRSHVTVLPLGGYAQRAGVILETDLPDDAFIDGEQALAARRTTLPSEIREATQAYFKAITDHAFLQKTCISDAIREAEQRVKLSTEPVQLVFISDMLEDCGQSLLNGPLLLQKTDIRSELLRANALAPEAKLADLRGAEVAAIVPDTGPTITKTPQPRLETLRDFWAIVFSHCNANQDRFWLWSKIPSRLAAQKNTEDEEP
jgi:hypothetical protein